MSKRLELAGQTFGRLCVVGFAGIVETPGGKRYSTWKCKCVCGNEKTINGSRLVRGESQSCGCLSAEMSSARVKTRNVKHGLFIEGWRKKPTEYKIWEGIKQRCLNPNSHGYKDYGGRGIVICEEWLNSFERFYEDMGPRPSKRHSVERVDNARGYFKNNCVWATAYEQSRNRRNNRWIEHNG